MGKKTIVREITGGVFGALFDLLLYQVYIVGASVGKTGSRGIYQAFAEADKALEQFNHHTLVAVWHQLTKQKLIIFQKRGNLYHAAITQYGKNRLKEKIPTYQLKRPWDGRIYLVTYDIPENLRNQRDILRRFLVRIGCKPLQESVFLTPYNPRAIINEFINKQKIGGKVIVSDVGRDGGIGESNIQDLILRLYKLENLNDRYQEFINNFREEIKPVYKLHLQYLSILQDDPQLPFELLPPGWLGDKAYQYFLKLISSLKLSNIYY